jgi:hypothetical protein
MPPWGKTRVGGREPWVVTVWVPGRDPDGGGFPYTVVNVDARKDGRGLAVHFRSISKNGGYVFMIEVYGVSAPVSSHLSMHESGVFWKCGSARLSESIKVKTQKEKLSHHTIGGNFNAMLDQRRDRAHFSGMPPST